MKLKVLKHDKYDKRIEIVGDDGTTVIFVDNDDVPVDQGRFAKELVRRWNSFEKEKLKKMKGKI